MWIMTSFGAFAPALRKPGTRPATDPREIQVRARVEQHLDYLRDLYMRDTLGPTIRSAGTDYEFRAYCTRQDWAGALAQMALDTDYHSFKDTTKRFPATDWQLHNLYLKMWSLILKELGTFSPWKKAYAHTCTPYCAHATPRPSPYRAETVETTVRWTKRHDEETWQPIDDGFEINWDADDDEFDRQINEILTRPIRRASGQLDHRDCEHANTRNARRRCRNRWKNSQR